MGQYFHALNIDKKEWTSAHDYDNGLKLMEHSYIGNNYVEVIENLLSPEGAWHKCSLVWAGDYANGEGGTDDSGDRNLYDLISSEEGDGRCIVVKEEKSKWRYIVNHSKFEYIDKENITVENEHGWKIHPLPLLTCEGNGRGGGDFRGKDWRVGTWSRDIISMESSAPDKYLEVDGNFNE